MKGISPTSVRLLAQQLGKMVESRVETCFCKNLVCKLGLVVCDFNPGTQKAEAQDCYKFKASMGYRVRLYLKNV